MIAFAWHDDGGGVAVLLPVNSIDECIVMQSLCTVLAMCDSRHALCDFEQLLLAEHNLCGCHA